jgi:hypothetical protein
MSEAEGRYFGNKQNLMHAFQMQEMNTENKGRNCTFNIRYMSSEMSYVQQTWDQVCIYTHFNVASHSLVWTE